MISGSPLFDKLSSFRPNCLTTFQDDSTEEETRQEAAVTRFDATNASEEDERHSPLPTGPPPPRPAPPCRQSPPSPTHILYPYIGFLKPRTI